MGEREERRDGKEREKDGMGRSFGYDVKRIKRGDGMRKEMREIKEN